MKHFNFLFVLAAILFAGSSDSSAQSATVITLDSKSGQIKYSQPTEAGRIYKLTIEGSYRQWPKSQTPSEGVDAVWYNDVPDLDNPIANKMAMSIFKDPVWLGDTTILSLPVMNGFRLSLKDYTGFRIDGEPLEKFAMDKASHRYQVNRAGTGKPFAFQILDSVYSVSKEIVEGRYDDNSGSLTVTIEQVEDTLVNICGAELKSNKDGSVQVRLKMSLLVKDSAASNGSKNILYDIHQIGIAENNEFVCPDSLVCNETSAMPAAIGIAIDASASMQEPISEDDYTSRLDASKLAIKQLISQMKVSNVPLDSIFILSFSNRVKLLQDWTSDKAALNNAIDAVQPDSATCFYTALIQSLEKVKAHQNPQKAVIALTDGQNTRGPVWSEKALQEISAKYKDIPLYIISLSMTDSEADKLARDTMNMLIQFSPQKKFFSINNRDSLQNIYSLVSNELQTDGCCSIYFRSTPCGGENNSRTIRLLFVKDGKIMERVITINCPTVASVDDQGEIRDKKPSIEVCPNPFSKLATLKYRTELPGMVSIYLTDFYGNKVKSICNEYQEEGSHVFNIFGEALCSGAYLAVVECNGMAISRKVVIAH